MFSKFYPLFKRLFRAWNQEYKFEKAKESGETHQSKTHIDCESNTSDDEKKEKNSDMDNNLVVLRTDSNKDCSKFIVSQETSLAVQNHGKSSKTAILDFSKAEGVIHFNSDYCVIEQHILAEKSLSIEEHPTVGEHDNGGKEGTFACQQKVISSSSGKTGLTGSINQSDRPIKDMTVGCHQEEKHDIIHIKVPCLSNIFDEVRFASNLPNSKSDCMVSVATSTCDMIVSNPRRSIEEDNLLASNKIISDSVG